MVVKRFQSRQPCLPGLFWHPLPLPVGEVSERSEDGEGKHSKKTAQPSQSPAVTALPKGEPRGSCYIVCWHKNGAYLYRYAPFTVLRPPRKSRRSMMLQYAYFCSGSSGAGVSSAAGCARWARLAARRRRSARITSTSATMMTASSTSVGRLSARSRQKSCSP